MLIYHKTPLVEPTHIAPLPYSKLLLHSRNVFAMLLFAMGPIITIAQLTLSEVCASNSETYQDEFGEYDDWVELVNTTENTINLAEWRISKNSSFEESFALPSNEEFIIAPNEYLILWADNQPTQGSKHLPFKLNNDGDHLTLYTPDGTIAWEQTIPLHHTNHSWGLTPDNQWKNFTLPTPLLPNTSLPFEGTLAPPFKNLPSGIYFDPPTLTLYHPNAEASIYFTDNGITPSEEDYLAQDAIVVELNSIIRATAFQENYIASKPSSFHCLAPPMDDTPIVSITADLYELFGFFGILNQWDSGDEIAAAFTYIENGISQYEASCGLEIHAPAPIEQQGFRLSAKTIYDNPTFDFPFFGNDLPSTFDRLILRNGGDDSFELGGTFIRDQIIHETFDEIRPEHSHSSSKLVSTYLNGEYWGLYHLRERIDSAHISHHFNQHNVDLLERSAQFFSTRNTLSGSWEDFDLLEEAAVTLDLSQEENYNLLADWMDISNFTDYQLLQIFISNQDWLSNNMKFWRPIDESEPWKWVVWDTDWGLGMWGETFPVGSPEWNALEFALSDWGGWLEDEIETELLQNLVENDSFLHQFVSRAADLRNSSFETYRWNQRIDSSLVVLENATTAHFARWDMNETVWEADLDTLRSFVDARPAIFLQHFTDEFGLGEINSLHLSTSPEGIGGFEVNSLQLDSAEWSGDYFELVPVRIKATPPFGYDFLGWSDNASPELERMIDVTSDTLITALYELSDMNTSVQLNEIMYASSTEGNDWIELKNLSEDDLDLFGFSLLIDGEATFITDSISISPSGYIVFCKDSVLFDWEQPLFNGNRFEMASLDLPGAPTTLILRDPFDNVIDSVRYTQTSPWPYLANGSGGSLEFNEEELDNWLGTNWYCNTASNGSPGAQNSNPVSIEDHQSGQITLAPNPFTDQLFLFLPSKRPISFTIIGQQGQVVTSGKLKNASHQQLSLSYLSPGVYTLVIATEANSLQRMIVKL